MADSINISTNARHAIYIRDNHTCVWCSRLVVPGAPTQCPDAATLDHIITRYAGGLDVVKNLVTACHRCNSRRQHRTVDAWIKVLEDKEGFDGDAIRAELRNRPRRKLPLAKGAAQAERVSAVLAEAAELTRRMLMDKVM